MTKTLVLQADTSQFDHLRSLQSQATRRAYKAAEKDIPLRSIELDIQKDTIIDKFMIYCAVKRGYDIHKTNGKGIIFGSKKEFIRRCKGLSNKEEWKRNRLLPLYSIGDKSRDGNRRIKIDYENRILTYKDESIIIQISFSYLKSNQETILTELITKANNNEIALTYEICDGEIHIIYDEYKLDIYKFKYLYYKPVIGRYMGIDLNPNRVGIAIIDINGNIIHTECFELLSRDQNIRKNELSHICDAIYNLMKHFKVERLGLEDLSSLQPKDFGKGRNLNRTVNQWIRRAIQDKLKMICNLCRCKYCEVNAAYSSFIGNLMYPNIGDPCNSAIEIARRCSFKQFYPKLINQTELVHLWKEMAGFVYKDWIELYEEMTKIRRLGWRSPLCIRRSSLFGKWSKRLLVYC